MSDRINLRITGDAKGAEAAAQRAEAAVGRLGDAAQRETRNLNLYGERLGRAFGPGEGLHGRLDALEMPLRDVEGGVSRAQQAVLAFGNSGASAGEKLSNGFLLAADSIAAFASGGAAGIAIAAAVSGFALLSSKINEQAEASRKAEEETREQAEALNSLADAALSAGVSLIAQQQMEAAGDAGRELVKVESELAENRVRQIELLKAAQIHRGAGIEAEREIMELADQAGVLEANIAAARFDNATDAKALHAELADLRKAEREMVERQASAEAGLSDASRKVADERARFSGGATDRILKDMAALREGIRETIEVAATTTRGGGEDLRAVEKAADAALERAAKGLAAEELELDTTLTEARAAAVEDAEEASRARRFAAWSSWAGARAAQAEANRQADVEGFKRAEAAKMAAANAAAGAITSGLFAMAEAGEFSAEKLLQASIKASGQQLVSRGTVHLMEGLAKGLGGNPAGYAESAQGGAMVAAGLAMGAASGAIGRASAPAPASGGGTPTDTRRSRAADTAGGGEGGTTVINFNGPAYDRRGVASVLASGQRMARHRRVQGA